MSGCQVGLRRSDCSKSKYFRTNKASIFVQIAKGKRRGTYASAGEKGGGKGGAAPSPDFDDADMKDLENFFKNDPVFQVAS